MVENTPLLPDSAPPAVDELALDPAVTRELYGQVKAAREAAQVSQPLGDGSALDLLAMRDHVIGLEAELVNARAETLHWFTIAGALRAELGRKGTVRALRGLRVARPYAVRAVRRSQAALQQRRTARSGL